MPTACHRRVRVLLVVFAQLVLVLGSASAPLLYPAPAFAKDPFRKGAIRKERKVGKRRRTSERSIDSLAFSPDGRLLVTGRGDGRVIVWAFPAMKKLHTIEDHRKAGSDRCWVGQIAFHPSGNVFATSADAEDRTVRVYDAHTFEPLHQLTGPRFHTYGLQFSPDGKLLAAGSLDVHLWDAETFESKGKLKVDDGCINEIAFSGNSRWLAVATMEGDTRVFDMRDRSLARRIPQAQVGRPKFAANSMHLAFSPDGKKLAIGYYFSEDIHVHEVATGKEVSRISGHTNMSVTFAFSPDGERLVSGAHDHTIRFWRVSDGKLLKTRKARADVMAVSFSPDGQKVVAGAADGRVWLWDWGYELDELE